MTVTKYFKRQILNYFKLKMMVFFEFYFVKFRSDKIIKILNRVSFEKFSLKRLSRMRFPKFYYCCPLRTLFRFGNNFLLFKLDIHFFHFFALLLFKMVVFLLFFYCISCFNLNFLSLFSLPVLLLSNEIFLVLQVS